MATFLKAADRPASNSRTIRFDGGVHGTGISFFAVNNDPGQGVELHVHPYAETWIVTEGRVTFHADGEIIDAGPDDILVVPANTPHGFTNTGTGRLIMMCIHDSPEIIQTYVKDLPARS